MGAKYEMLFLSDMDNKSILTTISNVISKFGWYYNRHGFGKYSYWSDSPIWKFESSKEVTECEMDKNDNINKLTDIIELISPFYSQSIVFHRSVNNRVMQAIASIVESPNLIWKEVGISWELHDLFATYENIDTISREVKEIFINLSTNLKPFYGKAAVEMKGLIDEPKQLEIEESTLGDFNYFSFECPNLDKLNNIAEKYEIFDYDGFGRFIYTNKHIGEH